MKRFGMKNIRIICVRIFGLLSVLIVSACTQISLGVVNFPTQFDSVKVTRDVSFGKEPWQKLDIYVPEKAKSESKLPVIVFYYGGRWTDGSKDDYQFVGSSLAKENFIVVIADYRKYPQVKFPAFIDDAAQSLVWVADHIDQYGGNPESIHLSGHSAGAHIASLLVTDARYLKAHGKDRSDIIRDFVGLAGPYDFEPHEKDLIDMFGPPENYPQMQATTFVDGRQPPMLLLWGDKDQYVGKFNMDKLADGIAEKGGCVQKKIYPDIDHIWLLADLSWLGGAKSMTKKDWLCFIQNNNCPNPEDKK